MKKKCIAVFILLIFTGIILKFVYIRYDNQNAKELMRATIFSNGCYNATYYFVLYSNRTIKVIYGERNPDIHVDSDDFILKTFKKKVKKINTNKFKDLINQANNIYTRGTNLSQNLELVDDGLSVEIHYKGKTFSIYYETTDFIELQNLIDDLIDESPMSVKFNDTSL